jgi:hypothetical protein
MAEISITIDDAHLARAVDAFAHYFGYTDMIGNPAFVPGGEEPRTIPNPLTRGQFMKAQVARFIRETVKASEVARVAVADIDIS